MISAILDVAKRIYERSPLLRSIYKSLPASFRMQARVPFVQRDSGIPEFEIEPSDDHTFIEPESIRYVKDPEKWATGVNLIGFFSGQFGLGESARQYARALIGTGIPLTLINLELDLPHAMGDQSLKDFYSDDAPYPVNLIFVNPDWWANATHSLGPALFESKKNIACWFWELEKFPDTWKATIKDVDGFLAPSNFILAAIRDATDKPAVVANLPISLRSHAVPSRRKFGLPEDAFIFLITFDFNSFVERKNPFAAIEAFKSAFSEADSSVLLLIKTSNANNNFYDAKRLVDAVDGYPNIKVRNGILSNDELHALFETIDCYVSSHRSEGFGMGLAETMLHRKPVIATAWSGNMDFMDAENSYLVDFDLIPVGDGQYLDSDSAGQRWANIDSQALGAQMRAVASDIPKAQALGERAKVSVENALNPRKIGEALATWIQAV